MTDLSTFPITRKWPAAHPDRLQLYSLPTPNGVKVSIMLEEIGLTYEAPCVTYIKEGKGDIVEVVYPVEGTTNSPFASAIIKDAKNMANAKLFIDFLASDEAQKLWA